MTQCIEVTIDIASHLAEATGIPKERVAEHLADIFMEILFPKSETHYTTSVSMSIPFV